MIAQLINTIVFIICATVFVGFTFWGTLIATGDFVMALWAPVVGAALVGLIGAIAAFRDSSWYWHWKHRHDRCGDVASVQPLEEGSQGRSAPKQLDGIATPRKPTLAELGRSTGRFAAEFSGLINRERISDSAAMLSIRCWDCGRPLPVARREVVECLACGQTNKVSSAEQLEQLSQFVPGIFELLGAADYASCVTCPEEFELYVEHSLEIIRQENRASTSLLQHRLNFSFKLANALIVELEKRGILGPGKGAQPREILVDLNAPV